MNHAILLEQQTWSEMLQEFNNTVGQEILNTIFGLFDALNFRLYGEAVWNWVMGMVTALSLTSPQDFSSSAWNYVVNDILSFTMAIGATLLNVFFMVGILRQSTNLRDGFTFEQVIDTIIKMFFSNLLILNGLSFIGTLFDLAGISASVFLVETPPSISRSEWDMGDILFDFIIGGLVFFIVALVCSAQIFMTVYSRYLTLYLLVATYPIAYATLPAGHGVSNTASSFTRTFLSKTFEIVLIALSLSIASKMCQSIDFGQMADGTLGASFDGFIQCLQSMASMVIVTGAVKGTDSFMRRAFNL